MDDVGSKLLAPLLVMDMLSNSPSMNRPERKVCTRAKGNKMKYGIKCRYGGSCDGTKPRCRHAIY